ncbi:predicted protein [Phaeodactylum tricornutum CCAP 1055/1]|jgi:translocator assembly and maintenance protein 41|uniref:Phosphatidate cytidylyltransferase, mitochondrial n=2 Tax=Phaeodactylum tricornutum TaxID=2850 RepID=B7GA00_PHATC|nr:predicted protein [Phaeodactylum tricornutum CCAP 1055/1]EEC44651.1 predicted protein [Phaeodactylum tricornutum CCAP 1055/1]|eukprot:XP_002183982.1 predicted protein [Phaeodactylum tricornutum CCAP 1055/1]
MEVQSSKGQLQTVASLRKLLEDTLPLDNVVYAFGYGSGVLSQEIVTKEKADDSNMIDVIMVVDDAFSFHQTNILLNPAHYALPFWTRFRKSMPEVWATWWQRHSVNNQLLRNPRVYFNIAPGLKYGVVQANDLVDDLQHWNYLYLAGRMHKPIVPILERPSPALAEITNAQLQFNLPAALSASLLLLSESSSFTNIPEETVYTQIASLSYAGDFRMQTGAEDPQKVRKLVQSPGQLERFRNLYSDAIRLLEGQGMLSITKGQSNTLQWAWDGANANTQSALFKSLPPVLQSEYDSQKSQQALQKMRNALPAIVAPAARYQSLKGLITAGPRKSWVYAMRKLSKGLLKR